MTIKDAALAKANAQGAATVQGQPPQSSAPTIFERVVQNEAAIAKALPKHLDAGRFSRQVLTTLRTNPKLAECSWQSVIGGMLLGAQLGLELNSPQGHAYLVPFNKEAQFILGYRGIIHLSNQSGQLKSIEARTVYEGDEFEFSYGLEGTLVHKPTLKDKGEPIAYYGVAKFTNGGHYYVVLSPSDIDKHRKASRAANLPNGPWVQWFDEMARKTCIRVMAPYLPLSPELQREIAADETTIKFDAQAPQALHVDAESVIDVTDFEEVETPRDPEDDTPVTEPQIRLLMIKLQDLGVKDADRHARVSAILGIEVSSFKDLTKAQASQAIDALQREFNES